MSSFSLVSSSWLKNLFDFCLEIHYENNKFFKHPNTVRNYLSKIQLESFIEDNFKELYLSTYDQIYDSPINIKNIHIRLYLVAVIDKFYECGNSLEVFKKEMRKFIYHIFSHRVYNPYKLYLKNEKLSIYDLLI